MEVTALAKGKYNDQGGGLKPQPPALSKSRMAGYMFCSFFCLILGRSQLTLLQSMPIENAESMTMPTINARISKSEMLQPNKTAHIVTTSVTLPNVLFVGAQKAGSTAIAHWLFNTNGVCQGQVSKGEPSYFKKEAHFFNREDRFSKGVEFYAKRFQNCRHKSIAMDATPNYLSLAPRIHSFYEATGENLLKNLKIMVILRDPIARELSHYNHRVANYLVNPDPNANVAREDGSILSFDDYIDAFLIPNLKEPTDKQYGIYAKHLKEWFQLFDRNHILVLSYDELKNNSNKTQWRVKKFLGNDKFQGKFAKKNTMNSSAKVVLSSCEAREKLRSVFDPMNEDLYQLLDSYTGPSMEQRPFPRFQLGQCGNSNSTR